MAKKIEKTIPELREQLDGLIKQKLQAAIDNIDHIAEQYMQRRIDQIIALTLGLSDRWGNLEMDHCNGRKTALANEIGERVLAAFNQSIPDWMDKNLKGELPKGWMKTIRAEYKEQFEYALRERTRDVARQQAWDNADGFVTAALTERQVQELDLGTEE